MIGLTARPPGVQPGNQVRESATLPVQGALSRAGPGGSVSNGKYRSTLPIFAFFMLGLAELTKDYT